MRHMLLALILLLPATRALAWGDDGHRIVALIAARFLSPAAKTGVTNLLAADTDSLTARDIASRALWADRFRDSDRPDGPRYRGTREWHFVDQALDHPDLAHACFGHPPLIGPASQGPAKACVVDKIEQFATELRTLTGTDPERLVALRFLLHFVGDLHQPLHAADHDDQGGNKIAILRPGRTRAESLHGYWDSDTVRRLGPNPAAISTRLASQYRANFAKWTAGTPAQWATESFVVAKTRAYALPTQTKLDESGTRAIVLTPAYEAAAATAAELQLARAGMRLAALLNAAFR